MWKWQAYVINLFTDIHCSTYKQYLPSVSGISQCHYCTDISYISSAYKIRRLCGCQQFPTAGQWEPIDNHRATWSFGAPWWLQVAVHQRLTRSLFFVSTITFFSTSEKTHKCSSVIPNTVWNDKNLGSERGGGGGGVTKLNRSSDQQDPMERVKQRLLLFLIM